MKQSTREVHRGNDSPRLYECAFLERMTHVHPVTPAICWIPVLGFLFYRTFAVHQLNASFVLAVAPAALLCWSLAEYILHRFMFHSPVVGHRSRRFHRCVHGVHHEYPYDKTRLMLPPIWSYMMGAFFYLLFRACLGPVWADPFMIFFSLGYLSYDYIHFYTHRVTPSTRVAKLIKKNHMIHHFEDSKTRWGVSSPLWDLVFGTFSTRRVPGESR